MQGLYEIAALLLFVMAIGGAAAAFTRTGAGQMLAGLLGFADPPEWMH
jgi:hypothetical protein